MAKKNMTTMNLFTSIALSLAVGIIIHKYIYHHKRFMGKSAYASIGEEEARPSKSKGSCGLR